MFEGEAGIKFRPADWNLSRPPNLTPPPPHLNKIQKKLFSITKQFTTFHF